jgi:hypothetical protein
MIVNLGDGVIAAMPDDDCCYSHTQPAFPPVAFAGPIVVLSLERDAKKFYAAHGCPVGPHVFVRHK